MNTLASAPTFLSDDFLLQTETARRLYHDYARSMPIIDYHCHLPPDQIAQDKRFDNMTQPWLYGDHYKWRAMRTHGVSEKYCTGDASDWEKFEKWAETVPYTLRNPLYHWTHLELNNPFGIQELLTPATARSIYETCNEQLPQLTARRLLQHFDVRVVCTTDDPLDSLAHHDQIARDGFAVRILPTFRPDKAMAADDPHAFRAYADRLAEVTNRDISTLADYIDALKSRHDYFAERGCRLSDHGLEMVYAESYTDGDVQRLFNQLRRGVAIAPADVLMFKSFMLVQFAEWDHEKGWTQQFHLGALRNNNVRRLREIGPDTGWDSIGDFPQAASLSRFLGGLDDRDKLAKTIVYNLNPADNEVMATMVGNFNDGSVRGKVQFGSGWWFLDQKDGMERQMNALSNMGLISTFVGMLTDSRSFLSYSRHEYFRRILCNLFGNDVENGELPADIDWIGQIVQDICYRNADRYFGF
ncbi:glucuronate isomerase [Spirosoma utsteinense]|uniref:Uronate isomerase n=1 Tax=Spirosoma utsteinense TaxID=2585773 RepID=A0ABR6W5B9_9BACT|nr:glucuronate isomerase [Spirosoma utsteinense]MBC3785598.1 glucuronate isomerase [Spirosoma utsteinense]MBC3791748.1 glucuronate isomerase [Spirosoma utsteinense]